MSLPFRLYHRVMGLCLAAPLLLLVVTGIPLQFTVSLNLGSAGVPFRWVHDSYGISVPETALRSGDVVQLDDLLFWQDQWQRVSGALIGARQFEQVLVMATEDELLLAVPEPGVPVERNALPQPAVRFGIASGLEFYIETVDGFLRSTDFGANWQVMDTPPTPGEVTWLQARPSAVQMHEIRRYGEVHVSWERWLQDLHTGRFFGAVGVWIMNLASFVFILLGFTGLVLWYSTRRRTSGIKS